MQTFEAEVDAMGPDASTETTVVHLRREPCDVEVCGRSRFTPDFRLEDDAGLDARFGALRKYADWLDHPRRGWVLDSVDDLQGKKLGCFHAPKLGHAHLLAALADGRAGTPQEAAELVISEWTTSGTG
ncbi:MAG: DUF4326 domain-containing protein [Trueperaceae bacterium]|nr:DUF4326 domain-containing protein [Trueperaceae bacterium]